MDADMELTPQALRNAFTAGYLKGCNDGVAAADGNRHFGTLKQRLDEWLQARRAFQRS